MGAAMKLYDEERRTPLGYKATRTTIVLASASAVFSQMQAQDRELREAIEVVRAANFDLDRIESGTLEVIYATFDDDMMSKVVDEFYFKRGLGNIRDYGDNIGICELCGKGDSRDDGENRDKLRYAFKLSNVSGGTDVWCGSTCIINHALKVEGAATAEEARAILERSMREHLAQWKIESWRVDNPDHIDIPNHFAKLSAYAKTLRNLTWDWRANSALGIEDWTLSTQLRACVQEFRTSARFYQRRGHLTDKKMDAWRSAKKMLAFLDWLADVHERARNLPRHGEERLKFFADEKKKRDDEEAVRKARRVRIARPIV